MINCPIKELQKNLLKMLFYGFELWRFLTGLPAVNKKYK